ncbi:MAG: hypothetical protein FWF46_08020 [Oscillospiraceae bacterium]|nr:hypothetical protein [Oscillospiraceae bacterium]
MKTRKKVRKKKELNITLWLIYIAIISHLLVTIYSSAQYNSQLEDSAIFEVGKPIMELTNVTQDEINQVQKEIHFVVQNFKTEKPDVFSDVILLYNLQISVNSNIDLTYELYKNEIAPGNVITIANNKTPNYTLTHSVEQIDSYILVINFNKVPAPKDVANAISIKINAEQEIK